MNKVLNVKDMKITDFKVITKDMIETAKEMYKDICIDNKRECRRKCSICPLDPTNLYIEDGEYCRMKPTSLVKFLSLCVKERIISNFDFQEDEEINPKDFKIEDVMTYMLKWWSDK